MYVASAVCFRKRNKQYKRLNISRFSLLLITMWRTTWTTALTWTKIRKKSKQSLSITFISPLIDLYNQQFKLRMNLTKKTDLYMLNASGQQELNTHLNNQMTTLTPPRCLIAEPESGGRGSMTLNKVNKNKRENVFPLYISFCQCYIKVQSNILFTKTWTKP